MTETSPLPTVPDLPAGWIPRTPALADHGALVDLVAAHQRSVRGSSSVDPEAVASAATGTASWTRRQVLAEDASGRVGAWANVHDRAAGRSVVEVVVAPDAAAADQLAADLFRWAATTALEVAAQRGLPGTQLDSGAYATDERQRGWLADAGYRQTRTWLQMSRSVDASEAEPGALPPPREGVTVRRVAAHDDGLPVAADLQTVHRMLEESFADHFNSYRESFPEFVQRLREDPGHRWDHWWIATIDVDGEQVPGGALVGSVLTPDENGVEGSYIDYIGVHRRSRGRGVAKALLHTVIADAARRGRNRVGLEVDADSPTGADGLYRSMGWATKYETESWHRDVTVEAGA
ncbi:GNAT family N-acetyltransferase [Phycicoccus sp. SLBN-51]|uniref:GNAT family N-acetyltransferase n=1 Tax=Phycicoccus sp. SLBN-51 TaxID=2768447 RepID=UPI00116E8D5F|nr:GNAT family N-acetyltransferase [Phycicoccus sp. SLBN-51]TQJ48773.1 ribosomal protein S18 acetylase RimI-like enzyme [Phycicoccus sp. SLBN-51]